MVTRFYLIFLAAIFMGYGLYCLANPAMLAGAAGIEANSVTGTVELQVMYGGLQTAVGVLCLFAVIRQSLERHALVALLFIFGGLAIPRITLGLMNSDFSNYTLFAMGFEAFGVIATFLLLRRSSTTG